MPNAYERQLVAELAEGNRRAAKPVECERCGSTVLRGDDADNVALRVTVDVEPVDLVGEMLARLDGRMTFDLIKSRAKDRLNNPELWARYDHHIDSTRPQRGTIHREHRCDRRKEPCTQTLF